MTTVLIFLVGIAIGTGATWFYHNHNIGKLTPDQYGFLFWLVLLTLTIGLPAYYCGGYQC